ncbi:RDD family protein [Halobacterium yunchengense]|uniref:RDD family protein n=1 Tax=Halobacterium yunchengense TaxID=3108497 RepID=UPI003009CBBD
MPYCHECGMEVQETHTTCPDCGADLPHRDPQPTDSHTDGGVKTGPAQPAARQSKHQRVETSANLELPIGLHHDVLGRRTAAALFDSILVVAILQILISRPSPTALLLLFTVPFAYFIVLEAFWGKTLGKLMLGLEVVTESGEPISLNQSIVRNLLRVIDGLPTMYLLGFILAAFSDRTQRLGDKVANTLVVKNGGP